YQCPMQVDGDEVVIGRKIPSGSHRVYVQRPCRRRVIAVAVKQRFDRSRTSRVVYLVEIYPDVTGSSDGVVVLKVNLRVVPDRRICSSVDRVGDVAAQRHNAGLAKSETDTTIGVEGILRRSNRIYLIRHAGCGCDLQMMRGMSHARHEHDCPHKRETEEMQAL